MSEEYATIKQIEFGLWPANEVKEYAVAEINKSNLSGPNAMSNTVYDCRMGTTENRTTCATCHLPLKQCTGHFGYIDLCTPIVHPLYVAQVIQYLKCVCPKCFMLKFSEDQLPLMNLNYDKVTSTYRQAAYFKNLLKIIAKVERCSHCGTWLPDYFQNDGTIYKFFSDKKEKNVQVSDLEVYNIFRNIPQTEVRKMGFSNPEIHPEKLILQVLPVLPNCARPQCETQNGHKKDDDLSHKYIDIIKHNNKLKTNDLSESERQACMDKLKFHVKTLMDNSKGLAKQINGRPIKALKARLNGKEGLIRCNLSGKRVNFSARTVIGPDPTLNTDEIAVPHHIATTQTFPDKCHKHNIQHLQHLVDTGQANYIIRDGKPKNLSYLTQPLFGLLPSDRILKLTPPGQQPKHLFDKVFTSHDSFQSLFDELSMINLNMSGAPFFTVKSWEAQKRKKYKLQSNDLLVREACLFFDLNQWGFEFQKGDLVIKRQTTMKISIKVDSVFPTSRRPHGFVGMGKQHFLEVGCVVKRVPTHLKNKSQAYCVGHVQTFIQKPIYVQLGDVVERHLCSGDLIAFGRHPTLHKGSLMARRVKIINESRDVAVNNGKHVKTIRMNLAQTKSYNADFDGDEMNLYSSQSWKTVAELKYLMSTEQNLKSGQNGRLLVSIHQDAMTGGYLLTKPRLHPICETNGQQTSGLIDCASLVKAVRVACDHLPESLIAKQVVALKFSQLKSIPKDDFFTCCMTLSGLDVNAKLDRITKVYEQLDLYPKLREEHPESWIYSGHSLFSMLLPDDYEYSNFVDERNWVTITRGVMLSGTLCKSVLGDSQTSIIHSIEKEYTSEIAMDLVSRYQFLINDFLKQQGFSVGLGDCFVSHRLNITQSIDKAYLEANQIYQSENNPRLRETKIANALNTANSIGQKLCKEAVPDRNGFRAMIESGSKGSYVNIAQIMGLIGQQNFSGERIPRTYSLNRALPHCTFLDFSHSLKDLKDIFRSRGFIESSYVNRLHPLEVFFHTVCGREAVAASAAQTSSTGYSQRKLIKCMEDLSWTYADTVTNAKDQIISFNYGQMNLEPAKLIHVNKQLQCVDIGRIANRLNKDIEWRFF